MRRQLYRTQYNVQIATSDTLFLPGNDRRVGLILIPPVPTPPDLQSSTVIVHAFDSSIPGTALSFTAAGGHTSQFTSASYTLIGGTPPVVQLTLTRGASTIVLATLTAGAPYQAQIPMNSGDVIAIVVSAGGAGSTIDALIAAEQNPLQKRVSLSFSGPAILDQGMIITSADNPIMLTGEHIGQAFREEVRAISFSTSNTIGAIDITEVDCPCQE